MKTKSLSTTTIKTLFLDCGAWTGCSINLAKILFDNPTIICFEPDPRNHKALEKYNIKLHKCAVWDKESLSKLYLGLPQSNSLFKEKTSGDVNKNNFITVPTIDLSKFILDYKNAEKIIIKLNVEGAEYDIIEKMHKDNTLKYVNQWYIQWHWNKINVGKKRHDYISSLIKWEPWNAMLKNHDI